MLLRDHKAYSGAIAKILGNVGADECGEAVGKTGDMVRKWSNPNHDSYPNLLQAEALDRAYQVAGHGDGPISALLKERLGAAAPADVKDPVSEYLDIDIAKGALSDLFAKIRDPDSEGGESFSANEYMALAAVLEQMRSEIDEFDQSIRTAAGIPMPGNIVEVKQAS